MDARASRLLMSMRADKWAISYMPHWLRTQKIPGLSFRNSQTWTKVATSFSSWGETARLSFKQHNKVTGRPTICPQFFCSHGYSWQKEGADKGFGWKDEARGKAHWLGNRRSMLNVSPSCCKRQDGSLFYPHFIILQKVYFIGGAQLHWPSTPTSGEANTEQLASAAKDDRIAHMLSSWSKSIRLVVCLYNSISYFIWTSYSSYAGWIF